MIGLISYALDRNLTGISQYTRELLRALRETGCQPLVLRSGGGETGEPTIQLTGARLLPALLTLGQAEIGWHARKHALRLVHDPTGTAPLMLCPGKRVVTIHDDFPNSFPGHSTALDTLIHRFWLPFVLRRVDAVLTDSEHSKSDIQRFLHVSEEKITVIRLAAGAHFRVLSEEEIAIALERHGIERPYILYVGSLEPRKNLLRMLEAYIELGNWSPKWRLVIVGAHNYGKSSPAAQLVEEKGLRDRVTFTGYVPDDDLPALYNAADLFCFPSLYEGFGLPVLEAMACGTPVVTSNTSSLPEVVGDAALLVEPYNVGEIASTMRRVLDDPTLARELRQKGLKRAMQFTWERTARETIDVYESVTDH